MPPPHHRRHDARCVVVHSALRRQDRRDDEILRTVSIVHLEQIHRSTQPMGRSAGERGLPQPGFADDARVERRSVEGESKPGSFEPLQGVPEIDPLGFVVVGWGEYEIHTINRHAFAHRPPWLEVIPGHGRFLPLSLVFLASRPAYRTALTGPVIRRVFACRCAGKRLEGLW
jgi:hypothetical protein